MQKLSKAAIGRSYTIQWMFGVPEVMDFLREHHVEEADYPKAEGRIDCWGKRIEICNGK